MFSENSRSQFTSFLVVLRKDGVKKRLSKAVKNKVTITPSSFKDRLGINRKKETGKNITK